MGNRMRVRLKDIERTLEEMLKTHQRFNLKDLVGKLDVPVDVHQAVLEKKLNILRNAVYRVGQRLGLKVFCDGECNVIVATTLEAVEEAIALKTSQITGRGEKLLFLLDLQKEIKSNTPHRRSTVEDRLDNPEQLTLRDLAPAEMAEQLPPRKLARLTALRAKNSEQVRREFMAILMHDPVRLERFEEASTPFYKQLYGLDVSVPASLFSEGVVQPSELFQLWQQLAPVLRRLSREPDLLRRVTDLSLLPQ